MKRFICPECNMELQDKVSACPNCGFPIKKENSNKNLMIVIGAMALIIALTGISDGFVYLCTWFDSLMYSGLFSKYTLGYFLCFIECVMITISFASIGLIILFDKKREWLKNSILLIAGTYVLFILVCLLLTDLFNIRGVFRIVTALTRMIIWGSIVYSNNFMDMSKKSAKQYITICITVIILIELFITRSLNTLAEVLKYCILFSIVWYNPLVSIDGSQETTVNINQTVWDKEVTNVYATDIRNSEGYIEIWKVLVFSIATFGIYSLIWIYRTMNLFNEKNIGEKRSAGIQVVLCALVPFYGVYWIYKQSKLTEEYSNKVGNICNDLPIITLVLAIFGLSLIAILLIQEQINKNILSENNGESEQFIFDEVCKVNESEVRSGEIKNGVKQEKTKTDRMSDEEIEYLKKMKELKDAGILSDEEYTKERNKVLNK